MSHPIIFLKNLLAKLRFAKARPDESLLLLPHCLQNKDCKADIVEDIENCKRCGKCKIGELTELRSQYEIRAVVVNGGRQALMEVRNGSPRIIFAVACEQELASGIKALPFKRIIAIPNIINGKPCVNTDVCIEKVNDALNKAVKLDEK